MLAIVLMVTNALLNMDRCPSGLSLSIVFAVAD